MAAKRRKKRTKWGREEVADAEVSVGAARLAVSEFSWFDPMDSRELNLSVGYHFCAFLAILWPWIEWVMNGEGGTAFASDLVGPAVRPYLATPSLRRAGPFDC